MKAFSWTSIRRDPLLMLIAALSLAGLLPSVYFDVHELIRHRRSAEIDVRYAAIRDLVPQAEQILGYASDLPIDSAAWAKLHSQARFALAPHVLLEDDGARWVLINVSDPEKLAEVCAARGLRATTGPGHNVALAVKMEGR